MIITNTHTYMYYYINKEYISNKPQFFSHTINQSIPSPAPSALPPAQFVPKSLSLWPHVGQVHLSSPPAPHPPPNCNSSSHQWQHQLLQFAVAASTDYTQHSQCSLHCTPEHLLWWWPPLQDTCCRESTIFWLPPGLLLLLPPRSCRWGGHQRWIVLQQWTEWGCAEGLVKEGRRGLARDLLVWNGAGGAGPGNSIPLEN